MGWQGSEETLRDFEASISPLNKGWLDSKSTAQCIYLARLEVDTQKYNKALKHICTHIFIPLQ